MSHLIKYAPGDLLMTRGGYPHLWPNPTVGDLSICSLPKESIMVVVFSSGEYVLVLVNGLLGYVFCDLVRRLA